MIDQLARFPSTLEAALAAAGEKLRIRASDGRFAMVEHCCHLADLEEEGYGARIALLLEREHPEWGEFDGDKIAAERNYLEQDGVAALQRFIRARAANVARLRAIREDDWTRRGTHLGMGEVSLEQLVAMMVQHDREHARDIEALLKELQA
jgi:deoxyribodipyrimidine photolyase